MEHSAAGRKVLVIGYGNTFCGDDGAGWRAAEILSGRKLPDDVEIHCVHQLTPELVDLLQTARRVLFLDASFCDAPGEICCRKLDSRAAATARITHTFDPASLLAFTQLLHGTSPEGILLSVGIENLELMDRLSPPVEQAMPQLVELAMECISGEKVDSLIGLQT